MKKSTIILIAIVYVISIVIISIFGLRAEVYQTNIPVQNVECINESKDTTQVIKNEDGKVTLIKLPFSTAFDEETLTGTMLYLECRIYPDDASKKAVQYVYDRTNQNVKFITNRDGKELGQVVFFGKVYMNVKIMSTDGTKKYCEFKIWVY